MASLSSFLNPAGVAGDPTTQKSVLTNTPKDYTSVGRTGILSDIQSGALKAGDTFSRSNSTWVVQGDGTYKRSDASQQKIADIFVATGGAYGSDTFKDPTMNARASQPDFSQQVASGVYGTAQTTKDSQLPQKSNVGAVISPQTAQANNVKAIGAKPNSGDFVNKETGVMDWTGYAYALDSYTQRYEKTQEQNIDIVKNTTKDGTFDVSQIERDAIPSTEELKKELRDQFFGGTDMKEAELSKNKALNKIEQQISDQKRVNDERIAKSKDAMERQAGTMGVDTLMGGMITNLGLANAFREGKQKEINDMIYQGDLTIQALEEQKADIISSFDINTAKAFDNYVYTVRKEYQDTQENKIKDFKDNLVIQKEIQGMQIQMQSEERNAKKALQSEAFELYEKFGGKLGAGALVDYFNTVGISYDPQELLNTANKEQLLSTIAGNAKLATEFAKIPKDTREYIINSMYDSEQKIQLSGLNDAIIEEAQAKLDEELYKTQAKADISVDETYRKELAKKGVKSSKSTGFAGASVSYSETEDGGVSFSSPKEGRGQCGEYVNDALGLKSIGSGMGNSIESKQKLVTRQSPIIGGFFVEDTGTTTGHTGLVENIWEEGDTSKMRIAESNYNNDEKLTKTTLVWKNGEWRDERTGKVRELTGFGQGAKAPSEASWDLKDGLEKGISPVEFASTYGKNYPVAERASVINAYGEAYTTQQKRAKEQNIKLPESRPGIEFWEKVIRDSGATPKTETQSTTQQEDDILSVLGL